MLPVLHAERQLAAIEAAAVPTMTATDRSAAVRRYTRLADGRSGSRGSLQEALGRVRMKVVEEPSRG